MAVESLSRTEQLNYLTMVAWTLCLAALLLVAGGCGSKEAPSGPSTSAVGAPDASGPERGATDPVADAIALLEREVHEARDEAQALRAELDDAEARAAAAETCMQDLAVATVELQRYQAGLDRAVGELNRSTRVPPPVVVPPAARPRRDPGRITSRMGPYVQIVGSDIYAHGELWSYRDEATVVRLTLELFENERSVQQETVQLTVPANSDAQYRHRFQRFANSSAHYIVRASLHYQ